MLSILIPTYNYNAFPLVEVLQKQAQEENITYEIILLDDASTDALITKKNQAVETLENCQYHYNVKNLGRGENRNALYQKAKHPWILFLDCDTLPTASTFIKNYIDCFKSNDASVFYGGIAYQKLKPQNSELLRWIYGTKREAISLKTRQKNPYQSTLVSNILVQDRKSVV